MDFRDTLKAVDDAVDVHLGDSGIVIFEGVVHKVRGPFDRDVFTYDGSSARTGSVASRYSVQSISIPNDSRGGYLSCRGELFKIVDYDNPKDGRTVLILSRVYKIDNLSHFVGYPYPFLKEGDSVLIDGYPHTYPIVGY